MVHRTLQNGVQKGREFLAPFAIDKDCIAVGVRKAVFSCFVQFFVIFAATI